VCAEGAAIKLKMRKEKNHKQILSSLYGYTRYVNCGVRNEKVC